MNITLEGKRVFVSAGGAGMGRSTCLAFHQAGAEVFTCDINQEALTSLPQGIETFTCDVGDAEEVKEMMDEILPDGIDVLVNNAGIAGPTAPIENISLEEWNHTINVCLNSQFYFNRLVVPLFKKQRHGVLINLISGAGILGFPNRTPYAAAKWSVTGLTKTLAMELGPQNIRVNGIVPGNVNGERMDRVVQAHAEADKISPEVVRKLYAIGTSMQCFIEPEEIANMILFLSSDHGRHISGQIIGLDGHTETLYPRMLSEQGMV